MAQAAEKKQDSKQPAGKAPKKKGAKKTVINGVVKINASFNNTIVSITDESGNVLVWSSCGANGFKGSRKSTPFAGGQAAEAAARKAMDQFGMKRAAVEILGPGPGRESAIRALPIVGLEISSIVDKTRIPFGGCRPRKRRRV